MGPNDDTAAFECTGSTATARKGRCFSACVNQRRVPDCCAERKVRRVRWTIVVALALATIALGAASALRG